MTNGERRTTWKEVHTLKRCQAEMKQGTKQRIKDLKGEKDKLQKEMEILKTSQDEMKLNTHPASRKGQEKASVTLD